MVISSGDSGKSSMKLLDDLRCVCGHKAAYHHVFDTGPGWLDMDECSICECKQFNPRQEVYVSE